MIWVIATHFIIFLKCLVSKTQFSVVGLSLHDNTHINEFVIFSFLYTFSAIESISKNHSLLEELFLLLFEKVFRLQGWFIKSSSLGSLVFHKWLRIRSYVLDFISKFLLELWALFIFLTTQGMLNIIIFHYLFKLEKCRMVLFGFSLFEYNSNI